MSGIQTAGSFAALVQRLAVARTFVLALVGRLAYGVLPLCLLFTVQHATGSFAQAATAMAVNGLASLSMPLKSRAIDRFGQRTVIPLTTTSWSSSSWQERPWRDSGRRPRCDCHRPL